MSAIYYCDSQCKLYTWISVNSLLTTGYCQSALCTGYCQAAFSNKLGYEANKNEQTKHCFVEMKNTNWLPVLFSCPCMSGSNLTRKKPKSETPVNRNYTGLWQSV